MAKLKNRVNELLKRQYPNGVPSQETLAKAAGLSQTTVSRWINEKVDRFDASALEKWARFFGCRVGDLLYFEGEEEWVVEP